MQSRKKIVVYYTTSDGKCPYLDWLGHLDNKTRDIVNARIERLQLGLLGDWKKLANSKLSELRIDYGKGYRVYYRELNSVLVLLVAAGYKSDQARMIKRADEYLKDFEAREER